MPAPHVRPDREALPQHARQLPGKPLASGTGVQDHRPLLGRALDARGEARRAVPSMKTQPDAPRKAVAEKGHLLQAPMLGSEQLIEHCVTHLLRAQTLGIEEQFRRLVRSRPCGALGHECTRGIVFAGSIDRGDQCEIQRGGGRSSGCGGRAGGLKGSLIDRPDSAG